MRPRGTWRLGSNRTSLWLLALIVVVVLDAISIAASLWKPVAFDFTWFLRAGEGVAESGIPILYVGTRLTIDSSTSWQLFHDATHELGLWHPPLFVYSLGAAFRLLGSSQLTARLPGIASLFGTVAMTMLLAIRVTNSRQPSREVAIAVLAASLLLLNPLTVQYAVLLPDIDGTVLTFLTVAFLYFVIPYADSPETCSTRTRCVLAVLFAALLWTKLTTPFVLVFAWSLFYSIKRNLHGLRLLAHIVGIGILIFLASWLVCCQALGLPPLYPIQWNMSRSDLTSNILVAFLQGFRVARFDIAWLGLPLALLYGWGVWKAAWAKADSDRGSGPRHLLAVVIIVGFVIYTFLFAPSVLFPRYIFPLFPLAAALAADAVYDHAVRMQRRVVITTLMIVAALCIVLPDRMLIIWGKVQVGNFAPSGVANLATWSIVVVAPVVLSSFLASRGLQKQWRSWATLLIAAAVLAFGPENAILILKQSFAPYETNVYYGRRGLPDTVAFLHESYATSTEVIYAGPDVGYYWKGPLIDDRYTHLPDVLRAHAARVLVFTRGEESNNLQALSGIPPRAEFGDLVVYEVE